MDDATCDACGVYVRAYVFVEITDAAGHEHELSFCAHHGTKYMTRLLEVGRVIDLRYLVTA